MKKATLHLEFVHKNLPSIGLLLESAAQELSPETYLDTVVKLFPTVGGLLPSSFATQALAVSVMRYIHHGRQAFEIGPRLQEMLSATSLRGIDFEDLRLPYDAFYLALRDCPWKLWGGSSGWHRIDGVYVSVEEDGRILFACWGRPHGTDHGDDAIRWWRIDMKNAVADFEDLEHYLQQLLTDTKKHLVEVTGMDDPEVERETLQTSAGVVRVVFNLAQYLSSAGAETSKRVDRTRTRQRARIEKKLQKAKNERVRLSLLERLDHLPVPSIVTVVGASIDREPSNSPEKGPRSAVKRHWVRGHWRDVPYGPRSVPLSERPRRRTWLQPFLRGEGDDPGARKYKVK